jgi:hypothetical protein
VALAPAERRQGQRRELTLQAAHVQLAQPEVVGEIHGALPMLRQDRLDVAAAARRLLDGRRNQLADPTFHSVERGRRRVRMHILGCRPLRRRSLRRG